MILLVSSQSLYKFVCIYTPINHFPLLTPVAVPLLLFTHRVPRKTRGALLPDLEHATLDHLPRLPRHAFAQKLPLPVALPALRGVHAVLLERLLQCGRHLHRCYH